MKKVATNLANFIFLKCQFLILRWYSKDRCELFIAFVFNGNLKQFQTFVNNFKCMWHTMYVEWNEALNKRAGCAIKLP